MTTVDRAAAVAAGDAGPGCGNPACPCARLGAVCAVAQMDLASSRWCVRCGWRPGLHQPAAAPCTDEDEQFFDGPGPDAICQECGWARQLHTPNTSEET